HETGILMADIIPYAGSHDTRLGRESSWPLAPSGTHVFFRPLRVKGLFCALAGRAAFLFRRNPLECGSVSRRPANRLKGRSRPGHCVIAKGAPRARRLESLAIIPLGSSIVQSGFATHSTSPVHALSRLRQGDLRIVDHSPRVVREWAGRRSPGAA